MFIGGEANKKVTKNTKKSNVIKQIYIKLFNKKFKNSSFYLMVFEREIEERKDTLQLN